MTTRHKPFESNVSATKKRETGSKTPTVTTRSLLHSESGHKKAEHQDISRIPTNTAEMADIGQQRSKSAIRLDKSPPESNSSYKSSSITGPPETQEETMTFAVNEITNKVSKSTFSGEEHEEEEFTAQFEAPKGLKDSAGQNDGIRKQVYPSPITISNDKSSYKSLPLSPLLANQKGGWKSVVQSMQKQSGRINCQQDKPLVPTSTSSKNVTLTKEVSLPRAASIPNASANLVKVSFQNHLNIPTMSPIGIGQNEKNLISSSNKGQSNTSEKSIKEQIKEMIGSEKSNKTGSVPSFKDYLQLYKIPASLTNPSVSANNKSPSDPKSPLPISHHNEVRKASDINIDADMQKLLESDIKGPKAISREQIDEKIKQIKGLMTSGVRIKSGNSVNPMSSVKKPSRNPFIPTTFHQPKVQILNQIIMPLSIDGEKPQVITKTYKGTKSSSSRKTNLTTELPIISEDPEINLKVKKVVNKQNEHRMSQENKNSTPQQKMIGTLESAQKQKSSKESEPASESESQYESEETSEEEEETESSGVTRATQANVQDISQNDQAIDIENESNRTRGKALIVDNERKQDTQTMSQVSGETTSEEESEEDEEGSDETSSGSEEESAESEASGRIVEEPENFRRADLREQVREYVTNNVITQEESEEGEEYTDEDKETSESLSNTEGYLHTSSSKEDKTQAHTNTVQARSVGGREKYQQFNELLMCKTGTNQARNPEKIAEVSNIRRFVNAEPNKRFDDEGASLFKHNTMSSTDFIIKKYNEIESKVWDLKGKKWILDKEVRILQVSLKTLNARLDSLFDLAEDNPYKKDGILSLTSSELNQIFADNP